MFINSSASFVDACITKFSIESNGEQGGDSGHGSKTVLTIEDISATNMKVQVTGYDGQRIAKYDSKEVVITFAGDAEFRNFCKGIGFIYEQLKLVKSENE